MITKPGVYQLSAADYHAGVGMPAPMLSASIIKVLLDQSPAHARLAHAQLNQEYVAEEAAKFDVGTAVHDVFLEGIDKMEVIDAENWRTKAAKEARDVAYLAGKIPLLKHQIADVMAMSIAIEQQLAAHEETPNCFADGKPQQTLIWQEGGVWCKAMLDWLPANSAVFTDLKTTGVSANPEHWIRGPFFSTGCDIQAAFYLRGIQKVLGIKRPVFQFAVCETTPPYALSIVACGEAVLTLANKRIDVALEQWAECLATGNWPAYGNRTAWAALPPYMIAKFEEQQERKLSGRSIEEYLSV